MTLRLSTLAVLGALPLVALATAPRGARAPDDVRTPCPASPNCVSTEATDARHAMPPIPFTDAPDAAQARARAALLAEPRTRIVAERPGVIRAEARSRIFRFVDDVVLVVDAQARVFRFRSASRVGESDLGVNRARMTRVSQRLSGR